MTLVFMFPGQSSRYPEMMDRIIAAFPPAEAIVERASEILSRDLQDIFASGNESQFACNRNVQVGVFLCSYLYQEALADSGITGDLSLGLSLGEYNHLLHIGALDFEDALTLVNARGEAYDKGPEGMMASVFPLPHEELEGYLDQVRHLGRVEVANLNSPSQNVIAGDHAAVEAAAELINGEGMGVQIVVIERRIPMHTIMFAPVANDFRAHLEGAAWRRPGKPYIPNVLAEMINSPAAGDIVPLLVRHVFKPVQWRRSIDLLVNQYPDACFVEIGPGGVLFNLLQKSWHKVPKFKTDRPDDLVAHLSATITELSNAA